jgi:hypothetical protein
MTVNALGEKKTQFAAALQRARSAEKDDDDAARVSVSAQKKGGPTESGPNTGGGGTGGYSGAKGAKGLPSK